LAALIAGGAHASTLSVDYYQIPDAAPYIGPGTDFGVCCGSPPATLPNVALGSALLGGLPVTSGGASPVVDVSPQGQILWWTPGAGVEYAGSGIVTLPYSGDMFAPNSTGENDGSYFETAVLSGSIQGVGADVTLSISSDDDTLVYVDGLYVGGNPGVHGVTGRTIDLGVLTGANTLEIFYADRAQVGASLAVSVSGADVTGVPESATWAMMAMGFAGLGFAGRRASRGRAWVAD
jgi:hypothetical protein